MYNTTTLSKKWMTLAVAAFCLTPAVAQETEWEAQTRITGYIATEANYFHDLEGTYKQYGVSLSEAGLLTSYQPTSNITIKGVFVYRPDLTIDQMINEANAEWKATSFLNVKVGRFLTPLSPMNTYYYAPVNNSATLPFVISHHEFFPLNMDAVSINGVVGENIRFDYDLFAGGYRNALWLKTGPVGLFGTEDEYYGALEKIGYKLNTSSANQALSFGGGAHAGVSFDEYFTIGANVMLSDKEKASTTFDNPYDPANPFIIDLDVNRIAYGLNFKAKYNNLQLLGEVWKNEMNFKNEAFNLDNDYNVNCSFIEVSNNFGKLIPYVRFEYHDAAGVEYNRYTTGINYKPIFETTLKLEYLYYQHDIKDINGFVASVIYSF
ncbi:hypothetical protein LX69_00536 [Breznakibacter xylanolyticus]|uniref:Porin n=1 Tax=Breznakibacter xylanolyticus TaxID=990 RepID=A0A2W7NU05_9BACT|nr:hypothetical protein [Breznakibacter xylanolyticus]PZX20084.1 hypothetical protein LX69_00536 [Breznakibacter xylanolyticus]